MKPKIVDALLTEDIVDISCGAEHAAALSEAGAVFVWGRNGNGQIGTGDTKDGRPSKSFAFHLLFCPKCLCPSAFTFPPGS